jgi:hypothetical protein
MNWGLSGSTTEIGPEIGLGNLLLTLSVIGWMATSFVVLPSLIICWFYI